MPNKIFVSLFGNDGEGLPSAGSPPPWAGLTAHYIRQGASGANDGSDWTNAFTSIPTAPTRNHVYYIADGSYSGVTFTTSTSGTQVCYIVKATIADHGTSTGWLDTYGDGQAAITSGVGFNTDYWWMDGQNGGGPGNWDGSVTTFGIKVTDTSDGAPAHIIACGIVNGTGGGNHITLRHLQLVGPGSGLTNDAIQIWYDNGGITASYIHIKDCGRCPVFGADSVYNATLGNIFEYMYVESFFASSSPNNDHGEVQSVGGVPGRDVQDSTWRYCLITDIRSTGGLGWANASGNGSFKVYGCVFYRNKTWDNNANGVIFGWTGGVGHEEFHNAYVYNNTFINIDGGAEALSTIMAIHSNCNADNNLFYAVTNPGGGSGTWTANHNHFISTSTFGSNATTGSGDPFVDYTNFDFRLTANNTAGTSLGSEFNTDMLGNTRTTWTRGALEF